MGVSFLFQCLPLLAAFPSPPGLGPGQEVRTKGTVFHGWYLCDLPWLPIGLGCVGLTLSWGIFPITNPHWKQHNEGDQSSACLLSLPTLSLRAASLRNSPEGLFGRSVWRRVGQLPHMNPNNQPEELTSLSQCWGKYTLQFQPRELADTQGLQVQMYRLYTLSSVWLAAYSCAVYSLNSHPQTSDTSPLKSRELTSGSCDSLKASFTWIRKWENTPLPLLK